MLPVGHWHAPPVTLNPGMHAVHAVAALHVTQL